MAVLQLCVKELEVKHVYLSSMQQLDQKRLQVNK